MMNYKETLLFVAKCLTISQEQQHKQTIENQLKNNVIDWEAVVWVSTGHYVFPALYCQLKRAGLLHYLPEDLVAYMQHITALNRERNEQIIAQATGINELLLANKITPIFLKGTGNLLEGLYEDIAERMVGDIDIILSKINVQAADAILRKNNYVSKSILYSDHRHLARLTTENEIAAVELHKEFLERPHRENFNYETTKDGISTLKNTITVLGDLDKTALTIFSNQISDDAFEKGSLLLRNHYDFFLLSKKTNVEETLKKHEKYKEIIASYWAVNSMLFDYTINTELTKNERVKSQVKKVFWLLDHPKLTWLYYHYKNFKIYSVTRFLIFIKAFSNKSNLKFIISRITSLEWFKRRVLRIK